jgi:diguanylate cyclase (GGDEF)-like protein
MLFSDKLRRMKFAGRILFLLMLAGTAFAAVPASSDPDQLLRQADSLKTSDHPEFVRLLDHIRSSKSGFSPAQDLYYRYLQAWETGYQGKYETATPLLNAVIAESSDPVLKFRAGTTLVNMLAIGSHYEEAFSRVSGLLDQLPRISDHSARIQALGVSSMLYNDAGQYELGLTYAEQMLRENQEGDGECKARVFQVQALYASGQFALFNANVQQAVDACVKTSELLYANGVRSYVANLDIQHGQPQQAIKLLQENYAQVLQIGYPELISDFDASFAQAYWNIGKVELAQKYALAAVDISPKNEFTKSVATSYGLLYLVSKKRGDLDAALNYHEKYMAADKGYLNEVSAKALAFQTVRQQVLAKKLQIDTLNKQNQILVLQQKLGKKAAETSRLYIVLLLGVLAFIGLWSYRVKRSQLRFMKLARRDGLTGIFNRQHFVAEAELQLQYCKKSLRDVSMILIDLDHFKTVNDTHGHAVGDRVLQRAVAACVAQLRSTDIFGRLGGEEFGILLPECTLEQSALRAEQIRTAIAAASTSEELPRVAVSASFGVASSAYSGYELRQLLIHADEALYQAKRDGRNRVHLNDNQDACIKMG